MSKTIAQQIRANALKQERLLEKRIKEAIRAVVRKEFEQQEKKLSVEAEFTIDCGCLLDEFELEAIITAATKMGFEISDEEYTEMPFSIPEWVKGTKRTDAQLMLYRHNRRVKSIITSEKKRARAACETVLEKLLNNDFDTNSLSDTVFKMVVSVDFPIETSIFEEEVKRIMGKRNYTLTINSKEWIVSSKK